MAKRMVSHAPGLRCRQIAEADIAAVATLLAHGFRKRGRQFGASGPTVHGANDLQRKLVSSRKFHSGREYIPHRNAVEKPAHAVKFDV
jgi:hypothetical protein